MIVDHFCKKIVIFKGKKIWRHFFFVEKIKKHKNSTYQMEVGMLIVKVKKFGVVWYIPLEMTAKSARGGSMQTLPPPSINRVNTLKSQINLFLKKVPNVSNSQTSKMSHRSQRSQRSQRFQRSQRSQRAKNVAKGPKEIQRAFTALKSRRFFSKKRS